MNNSISPTLAQVALVECLGNESPSIVEIGEYNAQEIIYKLEHLRQEKRIKNESYLHIAMSYLKTLLSI